MEFIIVACVAGPLLGLAFVYLAIGLPSWRAPAPPAAQRAPMPAGYDEQAAKARMMKAAENLIMAGMSPTQAVALAVALEVMLVSLAEIQRR